MDPRFLAPPETVSIFLVTPGVLLTRTLLRPRSVPTAPSCATLLLARTLNLVFPLSTDCLVTAFRHRPMSNVCPIHCPLPTSMSTISPAPIALASMPPAPPLSMPPLDDGGPNAPPAKSCTVTPPLPAGRMSLMPQTHPSGLPPRSQSGSRSSSMAPSKLLIGLLCLMEPAHFLSARFTSTSATLLPVLCQSARSGGSIPATVSRLGVTSTRLTPRSSAGLR